MRFSELASKLTGMSCPLFGISWNPPETQRSIARKVIIFLEGRCVLFETLSSGALCQCIESVIKIKEFLTQELPATDDSSELNEYIRSMRKASITFLSCFPQNRKDKCAYCKEGTPEYHVFADAMDKLRGVFGEMVGLIAKAYGLDVEDALARIIPA